MLNAWSMKVLLAPVNIAGQPITIVRELVRQGVDAHLLQYGSGRGHRFAYDRDRLVDVSGRDRARKQIETLEACLEEGFDVFHFWLRTLFFGGGPTGYRDAGLDLPFIKNHDRRIVYRFTGFDVRLKSEHMKRNPYNPYRYGYSNLLDEDLERKYIAFLQNYVDQFVVGDVELQEYFPSAMIIPRATDLEQWKYVGVQPTDCPLVVHAPSEPLIKGTRFVMSAMDDLRREGLRFSYKLIKGMSNAEAREWFRKADIAIDQLCIGWHGVMTIECMALGKPVIVYIRDDLYEKHHPRIPIENANPDTIKEKLRALIKDFDKRAELGRSGRRYVEEVHDVSKVAAQWLDVYRRVLAEPGVRPTSLADVDYWRAQVEISDRDVVQLFRQSWKRGTRYVLAAVLQARLPWLYGPMSSLYSRLRR